MNPSRIAHPFVVVLVFALTATGVWASPAGEEEPAAAMEKEMVLDPSTGEMVEAPQYGGTITYALCGPCDPANPDTAFQARHAYAASGVVEKLGMANWALDRNVFDWRTTYIPPEHITGLLAERWETPDPRTWVFHIRQGVPWHEKAPLNGRELTAKDVEFNFHRYLGLGSGFSEISEGAAAGNPILTIGIESVTAEGNTVVFRLEKQHFDALKGIAINSMNFIYPPEVIEAHGDVTDWRNLVGTGPLMLTDWVEGSSITWEKNPNYWRFDEKFPQNRLPYVDEVVALVIPEASAQLAAMRSGQIDMVSFGGNTQIVSIDQAESLRRTNPDIVLQPYSYRSETSFAINPNNEPFGDIRVRQAMQLALDLETINDTYWQGWALTEPQGFLGHNMVGFVTPFDQWPAEVKRNYNYNAERAELLLDEAGLPRGADGIRFRTTLEPIGVWDLSFFELAVQQWGEIGVEVEIINADGANWAARVREHEYEGLITYIAGYEHSAAPLTQFVSTSEWGPVRRAGSRNGPSVGSGAKRLHPRGSTSSGSERHRIMSRPSTGPCGAVESRNSRPTSPGSLGSTVRRTWATLTEERSCSRASGSIRI